MKNTIKPINLKKISTAKKDAGFGLIESAVALTVLGACLAYAAPVFLYSKLNNTKNEIRANALSVSQRIFDSNRGMSFDQVGQIDQYGATIAASVVDTPRTEDITNTTTKAGGRQFTAKVSYCLTDVADPCTRDYKRIKIEIKDTKSNLLVYEVDTAITSFR
jgi:prepilin-type N-terminal cleavage/methylation domain-containing protein